MTLLFSPVADKKGDHMAEERITLRIDAELLERVDMVVEDDVNIANRSHFFRVAAEEKLNIRNGEYTTIRLPDGLRELVDIELSSGMYNNLGDIIAKSLRVLYGIEEHNMEVIAEKIKQMDSTLRVMKK